MATYSELLTIANGASGAALYAQVKIACIIACDLIRQEAGATTNHANRLKWAATTLNDPDTMTKKMVLAVLAQNSSLTPAQITGATDASVQTAVTAAVDLLAQG